MLRWALYCLLLCCLILGRYYYPCLRHEETEAPRGYMPIIMKVVSGRTMIQIQFHLIPNPEYFPLYSTPNLTSSVGANNFIQKKERENTTENQS